MGGMGLTRRARDAQTASEAALEVNTALLSQLDRDQDVLQVLESAIAGVRQAVQADELVKAFQTLEGADVFMEANTMWEGLPEGQLVQLMHLLYAAWVTACRKLKACGQLDASVIPNWRYVLRRAIATAEQMNSLCSSEASMTQAGDVLESMVESLDEEDEQAGSSQYDLEAQMGVYLRGMGRGPDATLGEASELNDSSMAAQQGRHEHQATGSGRSSAPEVLQSPDDLGGNLEDQVRNLGTRHPCSSGRDDASDDGSQPPLAGRLAALDDPLRLPILLRVVARLPRDHHMRQEVEGELGITAGTPGWQQAVDDAMAAAAQAGHVLPPVGDGDGSAAGGATLAAGLPSLPNLLLPFGDNSGEGFAGVADGQVPSLSLFSPQGGLVTCESRLALFGSKSDAGLLGDAERQSLGGAADGLAVGRGRGRGGLVDVLSTDGTAAGTGAAGASSLLAGSMISLGSEGAGAGMGVGPSMSSASAMASLAALITGEDGGSLQQAAAGGVQGEGEGGVLGSSARVEFSSAEGAAGDGLLLQGSHMAGLDAPSTAANCDSPGVWGSLLAGDVDVRSSSPYPMAAGLGGDDFVGEPGSAYEDFLAGGGLEDGVAVLGDALGFTANPAGKRAGSLLGLPRNKLTRFA